MGNFGRSNISVYPKDDINPRLKSDLWGLSYFRAVWDDYIGGELEVSRGLSDKFSELRLYSMGRQRSSKYKEWLLGVDSAGRTNRSGWMNVNFEDIFSPMPVYMDSILGIMNGQDHEISVDCVDEKSSEERSAIIYKNRILGQLKGMGIKASNEEVKDSDEVDMLEMVGGFKLPYEMAMETLLPHVFETSNWKESKTRVIEDLVVTGYAATRDVVGNDGMLGIVNVDPSRLLCEYSREGNFDSSRFVGYRTMMSIQDIRSRYPDVYSEDELRQMSVDHLSINGNPSELLYDYDDTTSSYGYDKFRLEVVYLELKTIDKRYTTYKKDGGVEKAYAGKFGRVYKSEDKKTEVYSIPNIYSGLWVVGSNKMLEFGKLKDSVREGSVPKFTINIFKIGTKSIVERCIVSLDRIQMINLTFQNAIAMSAPSGMALNISTLENITVGNTKYNVLDLITMYKQTGNLLYKGDSVNSVYPGGANHGSIANPVSPIEGGYGIALDNAVQGLSAEYDNLSMLTGIDKFTTNQAKPTGDTAYSAIKQASSNTSVVLRPIYNGYIRLKEKQALSIAYRIQLLIVTNEKAYEAYKKVTGLFAIESIKQLGLINPVSYGITIEALPSEDMVAKIEQACLVGVQGGKNGVPSLTMADYFFIQRNLKKGKGLKYIEVYLSMKDKKATERADAIQQENQKQNMAMQQQLEAMKAEKEGKLQADKELHEKEMAQMEKDLELRNKYWEHRFSMDQIRIKNGADPELKDEDPAEEIAMLNQLEMIGIPELLKAEEMRMMQIEQESMQQQQQQMSDEQQEGLPPAGGEKQAPEVEEEMTEQ